MVYPKVTSGLNNSKARQKNKTLKWQGISRLYSGC